MFVYSCRTTGKKRLLCQDMRWLDPLGDGPSLTFVDIKNIHWYYLHYDNTNNIFLHHTPYNIHTSPLRSSGAFRNCPVCHSTRPPRATPPLRLLTIQVVDCWLCCRNHPQSIWETARAIQYDLEVYISFHRVSSLYLLFAWCPFKCWY